MRRRGGTDNVHALEVDMGRTSLLVPSACIAEVAPWAELTHLPVAPDWVLGVVNWRQRPLAVISFDALIGAGAASAGGARAKLVVFYPPPGCKPWQFFALAAAGDPQPRQIDASTAPAEAGALPDHPGIAGSVRIAGRVLAIPDLEALGKLFYP